MGVKLEIFSYCVGGLKNCQHITFVSAGILSTELVKLHGQKLKNWLCCVKRWTTHTQGTHTLYCIPIIFQGIHNQHPGLYYFSDICLFNIAQILRMFVFSFWIMFENWVLYLLSNAWSWNFKFFFVVCGLNFCIFILYLWGEELNVFCTFLLACSLQDLKADHEDHMLDIVVALYQTFFEILGKFYFSSGSLWILISFSSVSFSSGSQLSLAWLLFKLL